MKSATAGMFCNTNTRDRTNMMVEGNLAIFCFALHQRCKEVQRGASQVQKERLERSRSDIFPKEYQRCVLHHKTSDCQCSQDFMVGTIHFCMLRLLRKTKHRKSVVGPLISICTAKPLDSGASHRQCRAKTCSEKRRKEEGISTYIKLHIVGPLISFAETNPPFKNIFKNKSSKDNIPNKRKVKKKWKK